MKLVLTVSWLILLLGFAQCNPPTNNHGNSLLGRYELVGHDSSGRLIFTGSLSLVSLELNHLKGQSTIAREKNAPEGLFDQNGNCEGLIDGKKVIMDLAPSLDDAGLILEGELNDGRLAGIWKLDGFVTSKPLGKFEAVKTR